MTESESNCKRWKPTKRDIKKIKETCACPPDVEISKIPKDANLKNGSKDIPDDALVLSPSHLKYIRFPLHPLFHVIWSVLNLHPMQLSPNSYRRLSAFLGFGLQVGVSIDYSDFFHFHDYQSVKGEDDYYNFASKPNCLPTVEDKPPSHKNWKKRLLLITGNWAAPELKSPKICSKFEKPPASLTTNPSPERIQLLENYIKGKFFDVKKYSSTEILIQISRERNSTIYRLFQPTHLLEPGLESTGGVISELPQHVAERERIRRGVEATMMIEKKRSASSSALGAGKRSKTALDSSALQKETVQEDSSALQKQTLQEIKNLEQCFWATRCLLTRSWQDENRLTEENKTLKAERDQARQRIRELESQLHARQKSRKEVEESLAQPKNGLRQEKQIDVNDYMVDTELNLIGNFRNGSGQNGKVDSPFNRRDDDNCNLNLATQLPNSNMNQVETSQSIACVQLQSNPATSNTLSKPATPLNHPEDADAGSQSIAYVQLQSNPATSNTLSKPATPLNHPEDADAGSSCVQQTSMVLQGLWPTVEADMITISVAARCSRGSTNERDNKFIGGGVIRSSNRKWLTGYAHRWESTTIKESGLLSLLIGLQLARDHGCINIEVETDSTLIEILKEKLSDLTASGVSINDIRQVSLDENRVAHNLADLGENLEGSWRIIYTNPPPVIQDSLRKQILDHFMPELRSDMGVSISSKSCSDRV